MNHALRVDFVSATAVNMLIKGVQPIPPAKNTTGPLPSGRSTNCPLGALKSTSEPSFTWSCIKLDEEPGGASGASTGGSSRFIESR